VIPVLDEAVRIGACLARCAVADEVVIADAGGCPRTAEVADQRGARVFAAPRGRAAQLNAGARAARSDVLLFLHADTLLPDGALEALAATMADPDVVGGCFRRRFSSASRWLGMTARIADLRAGILGMSFGDQGQFVRRATYEELDGFDEGAAMEDVEFARRLVRRGATRIIGPPLRSSPRRFDGRLIRRSLADGGVILRSLAGAAIR